MNKARSRITAVLVCASFLPGTLWAQRARVSPIDERLLPPIAEPTRADTAGGLFRPGSRSAHVRSGLRTGAAIGGALGAITGMLILP